MKCSKMDAEENLPMSKRSLPKSNPKSTPAVQPNWVKLGLALTLVPLIAGVLFIILWALDMILWDDPLAQALIGILFILFSFATNNAFQSKWVLAAGWGLLGVADLLLLTNMDLRWQIPAMIVGFIGAGLLLYGIVQTMAKMAKDQKK
jgi:uncharacterized membrane protein